MNEITHSTAQRNNDLERHTHYFPLPFSLRTMQQQQKSKQLQDVRIKEQSWQ